MDHATNTRQVDGAQRLSLTASASASLEISYPFHLHRKPDIKQENDIATEAPATGVIGENVPQDSGEVIIDRTNVGRPGPQLTTPPFTPSVSVKDNTVGNSDEQNRKNPPDSRRSLAANNPSPLVIAFHDQKSALTNPDLSMMSTPILTMPGAPLNSNANSMQSAECTCSPCECTLPSQVPSEQKIQKFETNDCFCDPCQCTSFPPSASASTTVVPDRQISSVECHCSPCECSTPPNINAGGTGLAKLVTHDECHCSPCECSVPPNINTGIVGLAKIVTHNECHCSPCECSLPPSNVSSDAGVVRGPSPIAVSFQTQTQVVSNEFASPMGVGPQVPFLQMQSTQVNAIPTLQTDHSQTAPFIMPYGYQKAPQQSGSQAPASGPYGRVLFDTGTPGQMYYVSPSLQATTTPPSPHIPAEYAGFAKPFVAGGQDPYSNLPRQYGAQNTGLAPVYLPMQPGPANVGEINQVLGQGFYNRLNAPPGGEKNGNFYICKSYNCCDEPVGNQDRMRKAFKFKDSRNQIGLGKDMATLCCPPKRRKMKSASTSCKGNKTPEVVLVREVYHFQKLPKVCQSRNRLSSANSSGLCRPSWSNAYKYRPNPCCISRVRPPRPRQNVPCAVCKACACICSNQSPVCSPKRSKVNQCWDNNSKACGSDALKIARKLSCGCEVVKIPKGPVSLVREYLIQGNGAPIIPIPTDKFCPPQQTASSLRPQSAKITEKAANSLSSEQREVSKKAETSETGKKKTPLITVSKIPEAPTDGTIKSSQAGAQRKASGKGFSVERRKSSNKQERNQSNVVTTQNSNPEEAVEDSTHPTSSSDNTKIPEEQRKKSKVAVSDPEGSETARDEDNKGGQVITDETTTVGRTKSNTSMKSKPNVTVRKASQKAITSDEENSKNPANEGRKDSTESIGWRNDDLADFTASDEPENVEGEFGAIKSRFFDS